MKLSVLDHLVLTVSDIEQAIEFYHRKLGLEVITFGDNRKALRIGHQKINLHQKSAEFQPAARHPTIGSADLCFIVETELDDLIGQLHVMGITVVEGPVKRTGAQGSLLSVYVRDPDYNLIELSNPL